MNTTPQRIFAPRGPDGLAQIGPSKFDLRGIRFMTDNEGADGAGAGGQGGDGQQNADPKPPWGDDPSKFDPDKAWKLIQNVKGDLTQEKEKRDQAIAEAVANAEKGILANIAKALGGGDQPETDPAKLNETLQKLQGTFTEKDTALTAAQQEAKANAVALQVAIHAPSLGANTALLLNNEQFKTSIASVEPTDEAAVKAAITKALQENAALKQPPPRSGAEGHTGPTIQSLEQQLAAATEKKDWAETIRLKQAIAAAKARTQ